MTALNIMLGIIFIGFLFQIVGAFKLKGDLILDGFLLQALALFSAILFVPR